MKRFKIQNKLASDIIDYVEKLSKTQRRLLWLLADLGAFVLASVLSYIFFFQIIEVTSWNYVFYTLAAYLIYVVLAAVMQWNRRINRYLSLMDYLSLFALIVISCLISSSFMIIRYDDFSTRFTLLSALLSALIGVAIRILWQNIYLERYKTTGNEANKKRVLLIGAGDGGNYFLESYRRNPKNLKVVGILDRDPAKQHKVISGVKVYGDPLDLKRYTEELGVQEIIVAIPSLKPEEYEAILKEANAADIAVYKMPPVEAIIQGTLRSDNGVEEIQIEDLLGRLEVELDSTKVRAELEGKTILITGAGGSIGSEISRQVSKFNPRRVLLLGHGENSIYLIHRELKSKNVDIDYVPVIADIQDYERLLQIFTDEKPDIVYHAAAHKHVPLMEMNPRETLKNNIYGTYNVARAVDQAKVPKMVMISTDKAVRPPNVMGASKRLAELIVTSMDQVSESSFSAVRFGNVLGSRGSVIPVFKQQIKDGGPVTVTDFRMTRYFMTIPEASRLVIFSGAHARGGEVFILDMGEPVKILDLAKKMILLSGHTEDEIQIVESGIRPGEKLYEELLTSSELVGKPVDDKIYIGKVTRTTLEEVNTFLDSIKDLDDDALKAELIRYANESAEVTE